MRPYRPVVVEYRLPGPPGPKGKPTYRSRTETGERVRKDTPGAVRTVRKSPTWWGKCRRGGHWLVRPVRLSDNLETARRLLSEKVRAAELGSVGLTETQTDQRRRPISEHLADYRAHLEALGRTTGHVRRTVRLATAVLVEGCRFATPSDIDGDQVLLHLAARRAAGASAETSNHYLQACQQFTGWLRKRVGVDALAELQALNADVDRRHRRRALARADVPWLLAAAAEGPLHHGLTGRERALLYATALGTGLRASELGSLTPDSFAWQPAAPTVAVEAAASKHRRRDVLPLRKDLAAQLRAHCTTVTPIGTGRLWPGKWTASAAAMLRRDLARAGIPYRTGEGVLDFHALRHSYGTHLAEAGTHPKVIQMLMRHSTITLTMDRYVHGSAEDLQAAVERLAA